jgi:hypothetical protein
MTACSTALTAGATAPHHRPVVVPTNVKYAADFNL